MREKRSAWQGSKERGNEDIDHQLFLLLKTPGRFFDDWQHAAITDDSQVCIGAAAQ